jgi:hypothetical protein
VRCDLFVLLGLIKFKYSVMRVLEYEITVAVLYRRGRSTRWKAVFRVEPGLENIVARFERQVSRLW